MNQTEYAAHRHISKMAVSKAVKARRITQVNGKIDPEIADKEWDRNTRTNLNEHQKPNVVTRPPAAVPPAGTRGPGRDQGPVPGTLAHAQLVHETAKARKAAIEVQGLEGKLISADEVRAAQTERATAEREALLNWPSSGIAAELAAKFNVPERDMFLALDVEVRRYLEKRSQQPLELAA